MSRGSINTVVLISIVILISFAAYFLYAKNTQKKDITPELTEDVAWATAVNYWGDCKISTTNEQRCSEVKVTVREEDGQHIITATYEGLRDDSVSAERLQGVALFKSPTWTLGSPFSITHQCAVGRGHQDFSTDPCI